MRIIKVSLLLGCLVAFGACATSNHPEIAGAEIADAAGLQHTVDGTAHLNLCTEKECEGAALEYTRLFRRAELVTAAISAIDGETRRVVCHDSEPTPELFSMSQRLQDLQRDLPQIQQRMAQMAPGHDLRDARVQRDAIEGLRMLYRRVSRSRVLAAEADQRLDEILRVEEDASLRAEDRITLRWAEPAEVMQAAQKGLWKSMPTSLGTAAIESGPMTATID